MLFPEVGNAFEEQALRFTNNHDIFPLGWYLLSAEQDN
jgi:hypothetical protein